MLRLSCVNGTLIASKVVINTVGDVYSVNRKIQIIYLSVSQ